MNLIIIFFGFMCGQLPNVVGLSFGIVQMVLYAMYRKNKSVSDEKLPEHKGEVTKEIKEEVTNDDKKGEMMTIEIVDPKKKNEEAEKTQLEEQQQKEFQEQEQPQNKVNHDAVEDKARPAVEPSIIEIPPQKMVACEV